MEEYFAMRIMDGALDYSAVVAKYPQFQAGIDSILIAEGREELIVA